MIITLLFLMNLFRESPLEESILSSNKNKANITNKNFTKVGINNSYCNIKVMLFMN